MSPPEGQDLLTKRVLVGLSHAVERFALGADPREPLVVIALFQRLSYFEREAATYRDIAARGAVTVVGLVEDFPPGSPAGVHHRLLAEDDSLAREWSVAVLGPRGGASLVAIDQESVAPDAPSFEHGRQFRARWSFRRQDACRHVLRLRTELRLPADVAAEVDDVLRAVASAPEPSGQSWWEAPLRSLAADMERAERGRGRTQRARGIREAMIRPRRAGYPRPMSTDSELPDTAMATGNDYQPGVPPGPIDPEERAVLDHLKDSGGEDVVGVADEDRLEYADAVADETLEDDR
jgi:DICT domain-containing protein